MSRYYEMIFVVEGFDPAKRDVIEEAIADIWECEDLGVEDGDVELRVGGHGNLYSGESEDEFAVRATKDTWEANEAPCKVLIEATYLEDLPYEIYKFDPKDPDILKQVGWPNAK